MNLNHKKNRKIDIITIVCIIGIFILIFIAVAPPILRLYMPDKNIGPQTSPSPNETDKPPLPEINGTLICTKETETLGTSTIYHEKYYYANGIIVKSEIEETKTENSQTTKEQLERSCNQFANELIDITGIDLYCDGSTYTDKVKKTQVINYADLDIYLLDKLAGSFTLEFKINTLMNTVKEIKEINSYTCNLE